jgi:hypothetical protein
MYWPLEVLERIVLLFSRATKSLVDQVFPLSILHHSDDRRSTQLITIGRRTVDLIYDLPCFCLRYTRALRYLCLLLFVEHFFVDVAF